MEIREPGWRVRACPRCRGALFREVTGKRNRREVIWHCMACSRTFGEESVPEYIRQEVEERRGRRV